MKGPAIFLAQFAGTTPPFDKLETMAQWAAGSADPKAHARILDLDE